MTAGDGARSPNEVFDERRWRKLLALARQAGASAVRQVGEGGWQYVRSVLFGKRVRRPFQLSAD